MSVDIVGNFLTVIRNAIAVAKRTIEVPHSQLKEQIAHILKEEGFIVDYRIDGEDVHKQLVVVLKYKDSESVIHEIVRVSRPGRRAYCGYDEIKPVIGGLGVTILTSNHGVITNKQAKKLGIGGEIICTVW